MHGIEGWMAPRGGMGVLERRKKIFLPGNQTLDRPARGLIRILLTANWLHETYIISVSYNTEALRAS